MSDEEVDELLKAVDSSSGEINYTGEQIAVGELHLLTYLSRQTLSGQYWPIKWLPFSSSLSSWVFSFWFSYNSGDHWTKRNAHMRTLFALLETVS